MWLILALLFLAFLAYLDTKKPKNFPPGPAWFPLIGCAWQLRKVHQRTGSLADAFQELSAKYGPLIGLRIGRERAVFVYGLEEIEEMFTTNELNGRPDGLFATGRTGGTRKGLILTDSEFFQEQKKFVQKQLKECAFRKEILMENVQREVKAIVEDIKEKIGTNGEVTSDSLFGEQVVRIIWALMAGNEDRLDDFSARELHKIMEDLSRNIKLAGTMFTSFPFLKYLCPEYSGYNTYVRVHETVMEFASKLIQGMKTANDPNSSFIGAYLETMVDNRNFSNDQLMAICMDVLTGGIGTTIHTIGFALFFLVLDPDLQKRAQEEIDRVVGRGRLPTLEDKPQLPYVEAIAWEAVRMFISRSILVPRRALEDTTFNGHFIPKGTILYGTTKGMVTDPKAGWKNPTDFNPERFLRDGSLNFPERFIPFGLGKRRCPGEVMAKANLFLIIAGLLHSFNFKAVPGDLPQFDVLEHPTPSIAPFKMIISLRKFD